MVDWDAVGEDLVGNYHSNESTALTKYFNHFEFTEDEPLAAVVPLVGIDKFFGTCVQNILIISKPFGWSGVDGGDKGTYSWPPDGYADSKARLIASFKYFAFYQTLVWMDRSSDGSECPDPTDWVTMMDSTRDGIMAMCDELAAYGFVYMGEITTDVDMSFFTPFMNDHFKKALP